MLDDNFSMFICRLFMDRDNITLFPLRWVNTCIDALFKNYPNALKIKRLQILNIRMLYLSRPCALSEPNS